MAQIQTLPGNVNWKLFTNLKCKKEPNKKWELGQMTKGKYKWMQRKDLGTELERSRHKMGCN